MKRKVKLTLKLVSTYVNEMESLSGWYFNGKKS